MGILGLHVLGQNIFEVLRGQLGLTDKADFKHVLSVYTDWSLKYVHLARPQLRAFGTYSPMFCAPPVAPPDPGLHPPVLHLRPGPARAAPTRPYTGILFGFLPDLIPLSVFQGHLPRWRACLLRIFVCLFEAPVKSEFPCLSSWDRSHLYALGEV